MFQEVRQFAPTWMAVEVREEADGTCVRVRLPDSAVRCYRLFSDASHIGEWLVVGGTVRTPFDLAALTPDAKNLGGDNGFMLGGGQAASYGTSLDGVFPGSHPCGSEPSAAC